MSGRSMSDKLKPCPFCGSADIDGPHLASIGDRCLPYWWIDCKACQVGMESSTGTDLADAIAAWNRREEIKELVQERDSLKQDRTRLRLLELLAVIHRDGGQYVRGVGVAQACIDAEVIVAGMNEQIEAVDQLIQQAALAEREACALTCEQWRSELDNRTCQAEGWAADQISELIRARSGR
jgi:Lar family restriction alleviation protein